MKIRSDFVSNSSSSSFILNSTNGLQMFINDFKHSYVSYPLSDCLTISIFFRPENKQIFKDTFDCDIRTSWHDDDLLYISDIDLNVFLDLDENIIKFIHHVEFYSHDGHNEVSQLIMSSLITYFKNRQIDIDKSSSEITIEDNDDLFFSKLFKLAGEKYEDKK